MLNEFFEEITWKETVPSSSQFFHKVFYFCVLCQIKIKYETFRIWFCCTRFAAWSNFLFAGLMRRQLPNYKRHGSTRLDDYLIVSKNHKHFTIIFTIEGMLNVWLWCKGFYSLIYCFLFRTPRWLSRLLRNSKRYGKKRNAEHKKAKYVQNVRQNVWI